jgi:hypothetical protein
LSRILVDVIADTPSAVLVPVEARGPIVAGQAHSAKAAHQLRAAPTQTMSDQRHFPGLLSGFKDTSTKRWRQAGE